MAICWASVAVFVALALGGCSQYEGETCQSTGILVALTWFVFAFGFVAGAVCQSIRTDRGD